MKMQVFADADTVALEAAKFIAERASNRILQVGQFSMAVSGGSTPWKMLERLTEQTVDWEQVHWFQVDERIAPAGHEERNMTQMQRSLLDRVSIPESVVHPMPVESDDLNIAALEYAELLRRVSGQPAVLDLVHLGMGPDGHTASLVPGDSVLDIHDVDVALTASAYQNRLRMTLTYPLINRAREILWLMTGHSKQEMLARLLDGDENIPAGRVDSTNAIIFADEAAAGALS
jgi:6-phosphogluconolactonase